MKKNIIFIVALLGLSFNSLKAQAEGDQYLGQMLFVSFGYAPKGWAECNGQQLPIAQNQALFTLLGTTYGGNGQTTFALPNIQSRVLIGDNSNYILGSIGGEETHTLSFPEMPAHKHIVTAVSTAGNKNSPEGNLPADTKILDKEYSSGSGDVMMNTGVIGYTGGNQPHNNLQPYITFKCIIALQGVYPSRN